jgi:hypothetical protein
MYQTKIIMYLNSFPSSRNFGRNFTAFKITEMLARLTSENGDKNISYMTF